MSVPASRRWFRRGPADTTTESRALTAQTARPLLTDVEGGLPSAGGPSRVTPATAMGVADVYACIRVLADAAASLPLVPYRRTDTGRTRAGGRLAELLAQPTPGSTLANFVGQVMTHLNLYGNAYIGKYKSSDGQRVEQLALLHPDRVTPEIKDGAPRYTVNDGRGAQSTHGPEDIVHIRAISSDGVLGLSPVRQCRLALSLSRDLGEHAAYVLANGGRPDGVIEVGGKPTPEQRKEFRDGWMPRHSGPRNASQVGILWGGATYKAVEGPLDDMQFVEQRHLSTSEIARIFRVPPFMIGATSGDSMTYSNTENQALAFVTHSLRPWLVLIEQALSQDPDLCPGGLYVEFLVDALLRADSATRATIYSQALDPETGWMTRDEVRRLENLDAETPSEGTSS